MSLDYTTPVDWPPRAGDEWTDRHGEKWYAVYQPDLRRIVLAKQPGWWSETDFCLATRGPLELTGRRAVTA